MDIVSVTTTKPRFDMLRQSVSSILHQSRKPDLIVINLDKEIFHNDVWVCDEVSSRHSGVQIHVNLVQDIGPHTKLIPTLDLVFSEDRIVTIDDDIIYHSHFLERILSLSDTNPDAIACGRARRIRKNVFGGYASYMAWTPVTEGPERGRMLLPLGVGGVCYKKSFLDLELMEAKKILELAPKADDLAFRVLSLTSQVDVVVDPEVAQGNVTIAHEYGLLERNVRRQGPPSRLQSSSFLNLVLRMVRYAGYVEADNDRQWRRLMSVVNLKSYGD